MNSKDLSSLSGVQKTYSELLVQEFGQCPFLHYGLHSNASENENYQEQQRLFAEKIFHLGNHSCDKKNDVEGNRQLSVLLHGFSCAYLAKRFEKEGYRVKWIDQEVPAASSWEVYNFSFADGEIKGQYSDEKFDLIVVEGNHHYLQQMSMLSKTRELLRGQGRLIVFGEYINDDSKIERSTLPNLTSMRQLAERLSYLVLDDLDYTADAIFSIGLLRKIAKKTAVEITNEITATEDELISNRRCYRIFRLQKDSSPSGEYAFAKYGDIDSFEPCEISTLFEESFDTTFNPDVWKWKYDLGAGKCVIAREAKSGKIVSHYGGAPRQIHYFGEPNTAIQVCDVMVLPEIRRQYGKNSLFFKTAATFLEREIGNTVNHLLGFGFPNQKAMNIALRLGLYEKTDEFLELVYPLNQEVATFPFHLSPIDISCSQHQQEIDYLWQSMKQETTTGIIGDRHCNYIKYRYFEHPFAHTDLYRCIFLNDGTEKPVAAVFLKEHEHRLLVMDLICPLSIMKQVLTSLSQLVPEAELKLWITRGWLDAVKSEMAIENHLGIEIPCNSWNPGPHSVDLYGKWWLTAGDMDFM
ncbi:MAG: GNAT family N-acetyltransferase [Gammaproteobacteria bacterium]|nr:GNAT family N-acetyltransferase [Gammaproteobacteria bacterium]